MLVKIHVDFSPRLHFGDVKNTRQWLDLGNDRSVALLYHLCGLSNLLHLLDLLHLLLRVVKAIVGNTTRVPLRIWLISLVRADVTHITITDDRLY